MHSAAYCFLGSPSPEDGGGRSPLVAAATGPEMQGRARGGRSPKGAGGCWADWQGCPPAKPLHAGQAMTAQTPQGAWAQRR